MRESFLESALIQIIREEIQSAGGVLLFQRFMELALYAPELGYYERSAGRVGVDGDFYTSVRVGALFGELIGHHLSQLAPRCDKVPVLIEAGAHDGQLALDILTYLDLWQPEIRPTLWLVEPSPIRRQWQEQTLSRFGERIRWLSDLDQLERAFPTGYSGLFYANELLDAFPVHRLMWDRKNTRWLAMGVTATPTGFDWKTLSPDAVGIHFEELPTVPPALAEVLPDGFNAEICPQATTWWRQAAGSLKQGRLLTFDYGLDDEEFFAPQRCEGTLRAYSRHRISGKILDNIGEQDLTAHVHFTELREAGEGVGLTTQFYGSQRQWLVKRMEATLHDPNRRFPEWNSARVRQFQTLTHPEHLGRGFRVLEQGR